MPGNVSYSFGPGGWTAAVRAIIIANVAIFVLANLAPVVLPWLGLRPEAVLTQGRVWQLATYVFVHTDLLHILFNMLAVWMFGVDLERRWGAVAFTKFYFVVGVGAWISVLLVSLLPFDAVRPTYFALTIGASGAVMGLLMAWALIFPTRQILIFMLFPVQARYAALIYGAIAFYLGIRTEGPPIAHFAHLGGLVVGWLYLKGGRGLRDDIRYRVTKWRMDRLRRRFNVHDGGRDKWQDRIH